MNPTVIPATRRAGPALVAVGKLVLAVAVGGGFAAGGYATRDRWVPVLFPPATTDSAGDAEHPDDHAEATGPAEQILLSEQAQANLRVAAKPLTATTFWQTIAVPGIIVDRPGFGDRGVVAPATGVVTRIHRVAGDAVRPGEVLFTLKLLSESLHLTQTELFKAAQDIRLAKLQRDRLTASGGAVAEARLVETDAQITRLEVATKAYRQELFNRGLSVAQIEAAAGGAFVTEVPIAAPARPDSLPTPANPADVEVQEVKVELGQQVVAGQTLCLLANHQMLAIEGRAFRDEAPLLERTVREGWPVGVDFGDPAADWPAIDQPFRVTYVANTIDPDSRTFRFLIPLDNQSRTAGGPVTLWRFRPGQRVRLLVRVAKLDGVFVLPAAAVARDGAEAFVFRQNGDVFDRKPVRVVYQDRDAVVVANDGSIPAGAFVAQAGAAQLTRMLKARTGTAPKGFHIHADGSMHKNGSH